MKNCLYILFIILMVSSCGQKYEMTNMVPETIDVTTYIESGEYKPDSCEGRLDKLIKLDPITLNKTYEEELQVKFKEWKKNYNTWLSKKQRDTIDFEIDELFKKTKYRYTYIPIDEPIDVYLTDTHLEIDGYKNFKLFICIDKHGKISSDYDEEGWVINACDSVSNEVEKLSFKSISELINDENSYAWIKKNGDNPSCALHFNLNKQDSIINIEYSPECWIMLPYKANANEITVYWTYLIDTKHEFNIVKTIKKTGKKYEERPFMILRLINDTTLEATYPIPELIKKLNSTDKDRVLFPTKYVVTKTFI